MKSILVLLLVAFCAYSFATVYFKETFDGDWESRWKHSGHHKESEQGKLEHTAGKWFGDAEINKGIQTSEDNRFYAVTSEFKPFSNKGKDLVLQYDVKFEQKIDCGGGYLKFGPDIEQEKFHGETVYNIMFGPDFCGYSTKKVHVIFNYKGKNHLIKKDIKPKEDQLTHVYTLVVHPDNTYEVFIDLEEAAKGSITEDWDVLAPKTIKDPSAKKPADWVDESDMPDPTDTKPDGWDDVPKQIRDPEATQPEDWDSDLDGDWEAPLIDNPEYKSDWKAKRIPNPNYKGPWIHPTIPNPDYAEDPDIYEYDDFSYVGIDVWQVKSGTLFDHIFIGDDFEEAKEFATATWGATKDGEKAAFDEANKKEEAKAPEHEHEHDLDEDDAEDAEKLKDEL